MNIHLQNINIRIKKVAVKKISGKKEIKWVCGFIDSPVCWSKKKKRIGLLTTKIKKNQHYKCIVDVASKADIVYALHAQCCKSSWNTSAQTHWYFWTIIFFPMQIWSFFLPSSQIKIQHSQIWTKEHLNSDGHFLSTEIVWHVDTNTFKHAQSTFFLSLHFNGRICMIHIKYWLSL